LLSRRLTSLAAKRLFVADRIFMAGSPESVAGGSAQYQRSESIFLDRDPRELAERAEFPRASWDEAIMTEAVKKYGLEFPVTDEAIRRNQIDVVQRGLIKLTNSIVKFLDTQAVATLSSTAGLTTAVTNPWTGGSATIIDDLVDAIGSIEDVEEGYMPDTLIVHPSREQAMLKDATLRDSLPREMQDNPLNTGRMWPILGLSQILVTSAIEADEAYLLDSSMAGTIADEAPGSHEGYSAYSPEGARSIQTKVYREEYHSTHIVRGARWAAMWVAEPNAVLKLTNV